MIQRSLRPTTIRDDVVSLLRARGWVDASPKHEPRCVFRRGSRTVFVYDDRVLFSDDDLGTMHPIGYVDFNRAVALLQAN